MFTFIPVAVMTAAVTTVPVTENPCSVDYDCSLTFRQEREIERRLDGNIGTSFDECRSNCEAEFVETGEDENRLRSKSKTSRSSRSSISSSDCECFCLMFHDPCSQEPPTTTAGSYRASAYTLYQYSHIIIIVQLLHYYDTL